MLGAFEADATKAHDSTVADAFGATGTETRATSLVSMTRSDKGRLTTVVRAHRLNLSRSSVWQPTSTSRTTSGKTNRLP